MQPKDPRKPLDGYKTQSTNRPTEGETKRDIKNTKVKQLGGRGGRQVGGDGWDGTGWTWDTHPHNPLIAQRKPKLPTHLHSPSCPLTDFTVVQDNFNYFRNCVTKIYLNPLFE